MVKHPQPHRREKISDARTPLIVSLGHNTYCIQPPLVRMSWTQRSSPTGHELASYDTIRTTRFSSPKPITSSMSGASIFKKASAIMRCDRYQ